MSSTASNLLLAFLLLAANAFYVAAEFALVKSRGFRIRAMAEQNRFGARLLQGMMGNIEAYLACCQLGITMASLGLGIQYAMSDRLAFRGEIAGRYDHDNNSLNSPLSASYGFQNHTGFFDGIITVGLTYSFGVHAVAVAPPPPPPPPPAPPPPRPEPAPTKVTIDLRGVEFKFDHPRVGEKLVPSLKAPTADSVAILDEAIDTLKRNPNVRVEVDGHTDSVGTDAYNQKLSERRAKGVYDYLTEHGIEASRLDGPKGFGESQPIDTNDTAEGRQRNRRTELKVEN